MIEIINKEDCCGCSACANICPSHCITMEKDQEGFSYPKVSSEICTNCNKCKKVCPVLSSKEERGENEEREPVAYAAFSLDEEMRMKSSSGGMFTVIATEVLRQGGVVYGAAFDQNFKLMHIEINDIEGLELLRGSKYIQSEINTTYNKCKRALEEGRRTLFSGTPCQIEGLQSFLQKEYDNLICVDIICHGVPSPKTWEQYLVYREKKAKVKIKKVSFRDKAMGGWREYSLKLDFENTITYNKKHPDDKYMRMFLKDICLRPSCYQCHFKKFNRISDITLADFWGIQHVLPEFYDNKGTSLVFIHSRKGKDLLHAVADKIKIKQVQCEDALLGNQSMVRSVDKPKKRDEYFENIDEISFIKSANRYVGKSVNERINKGKRKAKQLIKRVLRVK